MKTHIPGDGARTFCGRPTSKVVCIDLQTTAIDEATCRVCQRSDDRRQIETWKQELEQEGARAYYLQRRTYPYDPHSLEARCWLRGYHRAKREHNRLLFELNCRISASLNT